MNSDLFFRHALELLITIPAAIIAFLPAKDHLRMKLSGTISSVLVFLVAFAFIGAAACIQFDLSSTFVILPLLLNLVTAGLLFLRRRGLSGWDLLRRREPVAEQPAEQPAEGKLEDLREEDDQADGGSGEGADEDAGRA